MGGRARDQRVRLPASGRTPFLCATGILAAGHPGRAFRARAERRPGGGAFMDSEAGRAHVDSEPGSASVQPTTRNTDGGPSAGVDARR